MNNQLSKIKKSYYKLSSIYSMVADYFSISPFYLRLLTIISTNDDNCTQKYLSSSSNVPKQTINSAITLFISKGYIKLVKNKNDKREKIISLTLRGKKVCKNIIGKLEEIEKCSLSKFSKKEIDNFASFFEKYNKYLESKILEDLK